MSTDAPPTLSNAYLPLLNKRLLTQIEPPDDTTGGFTHHQNLHQIRIQTVISLCSLYMCCIREKSSANFLNGKRNTVFAQIPSLKLLLGLFFFCFYGDFFVKNTT